jgi:predicted methyltransferase
MEKQVATLNDVKQWAREEYNHGITVYDYEDFIRITNGSMAKAFDVYIHDGETFAIEAERYGETMSEICKREVSAVAELAKVMI